MTNKKLIEVALPLEAINAESAREKSIRHGHPSTLHLWWARRPLAACRAVLFAQMVDDPSSHPELFPTEAEQTAERERLFDIILELVLWKNVNNKRVLEQAHAEIAKYAPPEGLPPVLDPFAGGGSIPLEAQRLGLEAHASDLNPVAVLINKALIEIPPQFAGDPPVHPNQAKKTIAQPWHGAQGLAEDVRYYGQWMRDQAEKKIGHLYPPVTLTADLLADRPDLKEQGYKAGDELTVIAWLWARTVPSPNPIAKGKPVPLASSFWLSKKKGKQAWVEPIVDHETMTYQFTVKVGKPAKEQQDHIKTGTKTARGANFRCLLTNVAIDSDYVKAQALDGKMEAKLLAIITEGKHGRIYLPPISAHEEKAVHVKPNWSPTEPLVDDKRNIWCYGYGLNTFNKLFTARQLVILVHLTNLLFKVKELILAHSNDKYADAITTYLAFAIDKSADYGSSICGWHSGRATIRNTFARQAIPMTWDFAEVNPFSSSTGNFLGAIEWIVKVVRGLPTTTQSFARQVNATTPINYVQKPIVSTDPPYYDNIVYADLSDFFYVWLKRALKDTYPSLLTTLLVPKTQELVAATHRFDGNKKDAQTFFENGFGKFASAIREAMNPFYPTTIFYAFRQTEMVTAQDINQNGVVSTGWETMLEGLIRARFTITGTWPMRTELSNRNIASGTNALASSIVLVCRARPEDAPMATRRQFITALRREMPPALHDLQKGNIAPVDMAQAAIGPGMGIFSRYRQVLESNGTPMRVRTALALINQTLDEYLSEQEGQYDADTRWALAWFEQYAFEQGPYGDAETLSTAKNTSVGGMVQAGFLEAGGGKVRLIPRDQLPQDWHPENDNRVTVWEVCQHLIHTMQTKGEMAAATLLSAAGTQGEAARDLAYRLYQICERKNWAQEALPYNALVVSWSDVQRLSQTVEKQVVQQRLFD